MDAVLAHVVQSKPTPFGMRPITAAFQRLAQVANNQPVDLRVLHDRPEF